MSRMLLCILFMVVQMSVDEWNWFILMSQPWFHSQVLLAFKTKPNGPECEKMDLPKCVNLEKSRSAYKYNLTVWLESQPGAQKEMVTPARETTVNNATASLFKRGFTLKEKNLFLELQLFIQRRADVTESYKSCSLYKKKNKKNGRLEFTSCTQTP